ncbi:translation initiation factor IF-2 [Paramagnetospirillum kuznetsovii]|uniref:Translation initiation factor IF-2 n=1 Tax=Paramagnetospirillum kuznetsovii TaxID=2053833 RepID=A0A364NY33_9PROT|nr:translation initiation factor IF-2 [Paramagnetospirillum kuznetsovii]RAU21953.1 translation initiation factor IF-2 [Paramagnetospirillum kuznetsovii]
MNDDSKDQDRKTPLKLSQPGKLELKKTVETGQVRQSFSHGRSKVVTVEVRKKRTFSSAGGAMHEIKDGAHSAAEADLAAAVAKVEALSRAANVHDLTNHEKNARARALQEAQRHEEDARRRAEDEAARAALEAEASRRAEEEARLRHEAEAALRAEEASSAPVEDVLVAAPAPAAPVAAAEPVAVAPAAAATAIAPAPAAAPGAAAVVPARTRMEEEEEEEERARKRAAAHKPAPVKRTEPRRRTGKLTITDALTDDDRSERGRSLAAVKRARERERLKHMQKGSEKVIRDVIVPESITVQELANRMAVRGADVIKCLMRLGVMANINQNIDADTAELVVTEFGHNMKRVSEADVLVGLEGDVDADEHLISRPPVVTIMGHVDHGKTSLLDALRETDVVSGEAGGITQHIGAYQVTMSTGGKITFIDTPGHEAFTAMRARGAKVTDIVVLVVAADDGIMPQTVEAIRHARAAGVPIIVAINKIDKPDANSTKVRQELLQHELVTEDLGGDVLAIEVSAKKRMNLEKLEEAILLQAEILDLKANPERVGQGVVIEAKMEKGRGSVATVLVQKGTLKVGDVFVAGAEWGRVRALVDDHGNSIKEAGPSSPVEVLGLQGTPAAGDDFVCVEDEPRAREIASYRQRLDRETKAKLAQRGTLEEMFSAIKSGEAKELPIVVKGDVQGSIEAIVGTVEKIGNDNVKVRTLHAAVGGINESDVTLARATGGLIIGFNVRANPQARDMARRDGVDIRYYSIIYDVTDDLKKMLSGMLAPTLRERFLGYANIREVFNITKTGKVAGCMITEGIVKRGSKVRLLRDDVVIHTGDLAQLKRFKDDVKEVRESYECGMSFTNYEDIRVGDVIECFEIEEVAGVL